MLVHIECPKLWQIWPPGLGETPEDWITSPTMSQPAVNFLKLSFGFLHWELNHFFCDQQMPLIIDIDFAMMFAANSVISLPGNLTSKSHVSKIELWWDESIGLPLQHASNIPHGLWTFSSFSGAIFLHLNIGPLTLGLSLDLHPNSETSHHFAIHPHMDHTAVYPLHWVLPGYSLLEMMF